MSRSGFGGRDAKGGVGSRELVKVGEGSVPARGLVALFLQGEIQTMYEQIGLESFESGGVWHLRGSKHVFNMGGGACVRQRSAGYAFCKTG